MKRIITAVIAILMLASVLTGCGTGSGSEADDGRLNIVTTIFPEYDWVREIAGDRANITMLLDNGVDLHSYNPTAVDMVNISACDMFIYVGGQSDAWVEDALKESVNPDMAVINLMEVLGDTVKEEEVKEGMEAEEEESEEEEIEYDEHVWLSLKNAVKVCGYITDKLCEIDPEGKGVYTANSRAYIEKLNALDAEYQAAADSAGTKTLLFGDRFPFRYMTDDYGLDYYAAFAGCSAETEASFETIMFLANKADELGLKAIMQIEKSDGKIAQTIRDTTESKDQVILSLNSMQSTTSEDAANGATYLSIMEKNLEVLKEALK
jgi:zinc transport system substrate-binding protein